MCFVGKWQELNVSYACGCEVRQSDARAVHIRQRHGQRKKSVVITLTRERISVITCTCYRHSYSQQHWKLMLTVHATFIVNRCLERDLLGG